MVGADRGAAPKRSSWRASPRCGSTFRPARAAVPASPRDSTLLGLPRPGRVVNEPSSRRSTLGHGLESRADLPAPGRAVPRRYRHGHQPRGDLPALYIQGRGRSSVNSSPPCAPVARAQAASTVALEQPQAPSHRRLALERRGPLRPRIGRPRPLRGRPIIGLNTVGESGNVVERGSRYAPLVRLPDAEGYRAAVPPVKNGPALGGYRAIATKDARTTRWVRWPPSCCGR